MALTQCPECGHQVSDLATSCPNCGFPLGAPAAGVVGVDIAGSGRFAHEQAWRRVNIHWDAARGTLALADGEHSMLPPTQLGDLIVAGDEYGSYEIQRSHGNVKPILFAPDNDSEFRRAVPTAAARTTIDRWTVDTGHDGEQMHEQPLVAKPDAQVAMGFTKTTAGFLFATAIGFGLAAVLYVAAGDEYAAYLDDPPLQPGEDISASAGADLLYGLAAIGFLVCVVMFLVWFRKAYKAAAARGATGTRWSSTWSVGGWFIPFANYVIPKLVMNEIDRISHADNGIPPIGGRWKDRPRLTSSDLWWASWLLANVATFMETTLTDSADTSDVVLWAAVGAGLLAAAGGLLGWTVLTIGGRLSDVSG